jgi:membrane protease YdiL (CAAX protease family)
VVTRLVAALFAYLAVLSLLSVGLVFFAFAVLPGATQGPFALLGLAIAEAGALAAVLGIWHVVDRRPAAALGLAWDHSAPRQWLRGAAVAVLLMGLVVVAWFTLIDGASWSINPDPVRAGTALLAGFLGFAVQGPAEEVMFRGYVFENVRQRWGCTWAVAVSAVLFGAVHAGNPSFGLLPFVNLVLFGVATALYKVRIDGGQLWGVFAIHSLWNWLQQVVFGLPNSGGASPTDNTLFNLRPNTALPDPIWGGGFGPEGTLGTTLVLLGLLAVTLRSRSRSVTRV